MASLLFHDLVAVVTGAGGGLGRAYALELAKRGASVVVNDLGSLRDGDGASFSPANNVVQEIKNFSGIAVANFDSVEHGEKIIECALKNFGKIDILINNAGILRDTSFQNMNDSDWIKVQNVHLFGAFKVTKAAWKHMRLQKFGRIIFTSSASGIYGNFGQANYSSAKSGLLGLCKTLMIEGLKYNINCNVIAPVAGSRMTEDVLPPDFFNYLKPELISPLVIYLCHPNCEESGSLFEVGAGWIGKLRWECSKGIQFTLNQTTSLTPEMVKDKWNKINDFADSRHPSSITESMENFINVIQSNEVSNDTAINDKEINNLEDFININKKYSVKKFLYKDVILYALSVGVSNLNNRNLKFLYENHEQFSVLPTYIVIPCLDIVFDLIKEIFNSPKLNIDLTQLLHGEQYLEMFKSLKVNENLSATAEIVDVIDKIRGAIVLVNVTLYNEMDELICKTQFSLFFNGAGGFNGKKDSRQSIPIINVPKRKPDEIVYKYIQDDQASLYRLNGDFNPLHIDPEFAKLAGFEKPIIHGLCLFGLVSYEAIRLFGQNDVNNFKKMKVRFSNPVLPGDTLIIEFWRESVIINFQCKVKSSGNICLSGGFIELDNKNIAKL